MRVSNAALLFFAFTLSVPAFASPDANWIHEVFDDVLHRNDTPVEQSFYLSLLTSQTYTQVAYDVLVTPERYGDDVDLSFNSYLGRSPTPLELSAFISEMQSGYTDDNVRTSVLGSNEFFSDAGSTNAGFVDLLFQDALGHPVDPVTRDYYVLYLNSGGSRTVVATQVVESNEFEGDLVDGYYVNYLDRNSDPTGRLFFLNELLAGATEETVQSQFMGSAEYYANAQKEASPEPAGLACIGLGLAGLIFRRRFAAR